MPSLSRLRYHVHTSLSGASRLPRTTPHPALRFARATLPAALTRGGGISPRFVVSRESQTAAASSIPPPARQRGGEGGSSERSEDEPGGELYSQILHAREKMCESGSRRGGRVRLQPGLDSPKQSEAHPE